MLTSLGWVVTPDAPHKHATRGFTDHEMLDNLGLIHMNGRVYDPQLGRFLSVDPVFVHPTNAQSLNPYAYVLNSPLSLTDPTGLGDDDKVVKGAAANQNDTNGNGTTVTAKANGKTQTTHDKNGDGKVSRMEIAAGGTQTYTGVTITVSNGAQSASRDFKVAVKDSSDLQNPASRNEIMDQAAMSAAAYIPGAGVKGWDRVDPKTKGVNPKLLENKRTGFRAAWFSQSWS